MATLGGIVFCIDAVKYDYHIAETIRCLQECCDEVVVLDAGSIDGTIEIIQQFEDQNTHIICLDRAEWEKQQGREKLAYFQNLALSFLTTDYYILCQADEIILESCFPAIRNAIKTGKEGFCCSRVNLWGSPDTFINVPENRQPCSTRVVRIAKTKYQSIDDGESIAVIPNTDFIEDIRIYHYGFVRKKEVMKDKIWNMQENVFKIQHDPKLDKSAVFDSTLWFSGEDLVPIMEPHSKFITNWIKERP